MNKEKISSIFHELEQICSQYQEQVPGRRRAWPNAIKDRIHELKKLGLNNRQIAKRVPVPYMTLISWQKKSSKFLPVKLQSSPMAVPDAKAEKGSSVAGQSQKTYNGCKVTTVTVVTPTGLRVEGLPIEIAMALLGIGTASYGATA